MNHEKIHYHEIIKLGFDVEPAYDNVYFQIHGFGYEIITKNLSKKIYLDWEKHTQLCYLIRCDKDCNIKAKIPVYDLNILKDIINFFTDEQ